MKCILFTGVIASILIFGEASKCYHSIEIDKPFNTNSIPITCAIFGEPCIKIIHGYQNGTTIVERDCFSHSIISSMKENSFYHVIDLSGNIPKLSFRSVHYCETDYCNGAQSMVALFSVIFASLLISVFASY